MTNAFRPPRARLGLFTPHAHFSPSHTRTKSPTLPHPKQESPTGHSPPEPCAILSFCMQPVSPLGLRYLVPDLEESHLLLSFILPFTQPRLGLRYLVPVLEESHLLLSFVLSFTQLHLGLRYLVPILEECHLLLSFILPFTQPHLGLRYLVPILEEYHLLLSFILPFTQQISQRALLCIRLCRALPNT